MPANKGTGISVGGSSMLIIFVLLCLTTFATLSLVSANADLRLTTKAAQANTDYYNADSRAEETLSQLEAILRESYSPDADLGAYLLTVEGRLEELTLDMPAILVREAGGEHVRYSHRISENLELSVSVRLLYPADSSAPLIARSVWCAQNNSPDTEELQEGPGVWDGGADGFLSIFG